MHISVAKLYTFILPYTLTGKYYQITELLNDIDLAEFYGNLDKLMQNGPMSRFGPM